MTELIIKQKHEDMMKYGYICLRQFPKSERHTLSAEIRQTMYEIDRLILRAQKRYFKKNTLQDLDIEIAHLLSKIRLAKELEFLPFKKYENWSKMVVELGKMVGGWIKSQNDKISGS